MQTILRLILLPIFLIRWLLGDVIDISFCAFYLIVLVGFWGLVGGLVIRGVV